MTREELKNIIGSLEGHPFELSESFKQEAEAILATTFKDLLNREEKIKMEVIMERQMIALIPSGFSLLAEEKGEPYEQIVRCLVNSLARKLWIRFVTKKLCLASDANLLEDFLKIKLTKDNN
jgi:hypothetical protein